MSPKQTYISIKNNLLVYGVGESSAGGLRYVINMKAFCGCFALNKYCLTCFLKFQEHFKRWKQDIETKRFSNKVVRQVCVFVRHCRVSWLVEARMRVSHLERQ